MRIAVTGGAGFVGSHLTAQLRSQGHEVAIATRKTTIALDGFDVLIHAAWDFAADDESNVRGSIQLFEIAKAAGVKRIIFLSSLSAFEGCRSRYGATKLAVEKAAITMGACVIRLGFVCAESGGLSGSLRKLAALPLVPLPGGGKQNLYTIQAEDLGPAFLKVIEQCGGEVVNLAHSAPVTLGKMMRTFNPNAVFLSFPWRVLWLPLRVAEAVGVRLKFRSDSLVSLMNQNQSPDFQKQNDWGIRLQPFESTK